MHMDTITRHELANNVRNSESSGSPIVGWLALNQVIGDLNLKKKRKNEFS